MSEADELAIAKARAAAAASRAEAEAVVEAEEAMLRSFPAKAREVLAIARDPGALGGAVGSAVTSACPADLHLEFHRRKRRQEVRAAYAALVALGDRYAPVAAAHEPGGSR